MPRSQVLLASQGRFPPLRLFRSALPIDSMMRQAAILLALCLLPSCATIFARSSKSLHVTSTPSGLAFTTDFGVTGVTPASVIVPNDVRTVEITLTSAADERRAFLQSKRSSVWIIGNVFLLGTIGMIVDVVNPNANVWPRGGDWHLDWEQGALRAPLEPGM